MAPLEAEGWPEAFDALILCALPPARGRRPWIEPSAPPLLEHTGWALTPAMDSPPVWAGQAGRGHPKALAAVPVESGPGRNALAVCVIGAIAGFNGAAAPPGQSPHCFHARPAAAWPPCVQYREFVLNQLLARRSAPLPCSARSASHAAGGVWLSPWRGWRRGLPAQTHHRRR